MTKPKISIVIPALNEVENIAKSIASASTEMNVEVIIVDGGSTDGTQGLAKDLGVKVLSAPAGRGRQMNVGANAASGDILLFLHADTRLPAGFAGMVVSTLEQAHTVAGAFTLRIDGQERGLRLVEMGVKLRSHYFQFPYGDQAIFLKTSLFRQLGGFPDLPIMEDWEMIRQLRKLGKIRIVSTPVLTSVRRWQRHGVCQTTLMNQLLILAYLLSISPTQIAHYYRRHPGIR